MKKSAKKLVLARETVWNLGKPEAGQVVGGAGIFSTGVSRCARECDWSTPTC